MPKYGKFGAASTAGWGAGAAVFSPVGRVVLLHLGPHWQVHFRVISRFPDFVTFLSIATERVHATS